MNSITVTREGHTVNGNPIKTVAIVTDGYAHARLADGFCMDCGAEVDEPHFSFAS